MRASAARSAPGSCSLRLPALPGPADRRRRGLPGRAERRPVRAVLQRSARPGRRLLAVVDGRGGRGGRSGWTELAAARRTPRCLRASRRDRAAGPLDAGDVRDEVAEHADRPVPRCRAQRRASHAGRRRGRGRREPSGARRLAGVPGARPVPRGAARPHRPRRVGLPTGPRAGHPGPAAEAREAVRVCPQAALRLVEGR